MILNIVSKASMGLREWTVLLTALMPNKMSMDRIWIPCQEPSSYAFTRRQSFSQEKSNLLWDLSRSKSCFRRTKVGVTHTLVLRLKELFLTTLPINAIHMLNTVAQEVSLHFLVKSGICLMSSLAEDLRSLLSVRGKNTKAFVKPISLSAVSCMLWPFNLIIAICTEPLINAIISWLYADFITNLPEFSLALHDLKNIDWDS